MQSRDLVKKATQAKIVLRQNYNQLAKKHLRKIGQYAHAKQYKRMRKEIIPLVEKLLNQEKKSKEKFYSFYHPEVECISKGKAHKKYEFGCKTALVIIHKEGLCVSMEAMHGNPYDGHTINQAITNAERVSQTTIDQIFLDKG